MLYTAFASELKTDRSAPHIDMTGTQCGQPIRAVFFCVARIANTDQGRFEQLHQQRHYLFPRHAMQGQLLLQALAHSRQSRTE